MYVLCNLQYNNYNTKDTKQLYGYNNEKISLDCRTWTNAKNLLRIKKK